MIEKNAKQEELYKRVKTNTLSRDIVVIEEKNPAASQIHDHYHSPYYYTGLCMSGSSSGQYDNRQIEIHAGQLWWFLPGHVLSQFCVSPDYRVLSLFIPKYYFNRLKALGVLGKYQYITYKPVLSLTDQQFSTIETTIRLIGQMAAYDHSRRDNIISAMVRILVELSDEIFKQQHRDLTEKRLERDLLFEHFYDAVTEHYRESHEIKFYADLLCLTPKYLATLIKQTTGFSASYWINQYVAIEAKYLLLHRRQMNIQQIAYHLGFSEQASFSRFFKKFTGATPTEYREQA